MPHVAVVLWHIEVSHYNEKVRWALDYKGIRLHPRVPMPGLHRRERARGHARASTGGCRWWRSTAAASATPRRSSPRSRSTRPSRPCTRPTPRRARGRWRSRTGSTRSSAPELRRFVWHHTLADTDVVAQTLFSRPSPVRERFLRASAPVARFAGAARLRRDRRERRPRARGGEGGDGPARERAGPVRLPGGRRLHGGGPHRGVAVHAAAHSAGAALRAHRVRAGGAGAARRAHGAARRGLGRADVRAAIETST